MAENRVLLGTISRTRIFAEGAPSMVTAIGAASAAPLFAIFRVKVRRSFGFAVACEAVLVMTIETPLGGGRGETRENVEWGGVSAGGGSPGRARGESSQVRGATPELLCGERLSATNSNIVHVIAQPAP